jgi:hypothetical protein
MSQLTRQAEEASKRRKDPKLGEFQSIACEKVKHSETVVKHVKLLQKLGKLKRFEQI